MTREDDLLELAAAVRADHRAALMVVGWWAGGASAEDVAACLRLVQESGVLPAPQRHLEAYRERWTLRPVPPS